jgi:hypothetical protein
LISQFNRSVYSWQESTSFDKLDFHGLISTLGSEVPVVRSNR